MADIAKQLAAKYEKRSRFSNFGSVITSMEVNGFRGLSANISFDYPVVAITGLNGAGKSTIAQLMLCAYKKISTAIQSKRYYIANFFPVSAADPNPFLSEASVTYRYQTDRPDISQDLTVSRASQEWSGYKRQPEKNVEYVGFTVYIPKVEKSDLSVHGAKTLSLTEKRELENVGRLVSAILGSDYRDVYAQGIQAKGRVSEISMASRMGALYSENNMGFGEGRAVYTVRLLENCPAQSLIVLEEPETSLHEGAQHELAKYLLGVSYRRGHQIIFTTHSSAMINALPPQGRKLLARTEGGVNVFDNVSSSMIKTALSDGHSGHVILCVEDKFAQSLLREILRRTNKNLLYSTSIQPFGDARAVREAKKALLIAKVKAIAVLDGDQTERFDEGVLVLPGTQAPEIEVFSSEYVRRSLLERYGISFQTILNANPNLDHHEYAEKCCEKAMVSREVLESDCIRDYLDNQDSALAETLCNKIARLCRSI